MDEAIKELGVDRSELEKVKTAEVGNIFNFGTQKSEEMKLVFTDGEGKERYAYMGSYGIGITRVMGVIVEKFADDKGLVWPENVAPFKVHIVAIGEKGQELAGKFYDELANSGVDALLDDRDERPGVKFADAELMGLPWRITIGDRAIDGDGLFELTERATGETRKMDYQQLMDFCLSR